MRALRIVPYTQGARSADNSPMTAVALNLSGLALALAIGLLLGVERGWQAREEEAGRRVAGIRTFALLGLLGGLAGTIGAQGSATVAVILVAGAIAALLLGYRADMARDGNVSATTTLAGVLALGLGALAATGQTALAAVGAGATTILLASRRPLHQAIRMTSESDIKALLRLVLVVFIILPLLPDRAMGPLGALNPFRLWTVVVVIGSISFVGYGLVRWLGDRTGSLLTAAVGALVSSTAVTLDAARRVREGATGASPHANVALASAIMLARSLVLVGAIAPSAFGPFAALVAPGLAVSLIAAASLLWPGRSDPTQLDTSTLRPPGLGLAFLFAITVALLSIASAWVRMTWGDAQSAGLIALGGMIDIDAAIATVGALPPGTLSTRIAGLALAGPTLFNTLFKLGLLVTVAGWRGSKRGAAALAATATALAVPICIALF